MKRTLPAWATTAWLLLAAAACAQDFPPEASLGDWIQTRLDAACPDPPALTLFVGANTQVLWSQFSSPLAQYEDPNGTHTSTDRLNALGKAIYNAQSNALTSGLTLGDIPPLPDSLDRDSATFRTPNDPRNTHDWSFVTAAPVVTIGCRTESYGEGFVEYRFLDGSGQGGAARFHTVHGGWRDDDVGWRSKSPRPKVRFSLSVGLRADAGSFDVDDPNFYYGMFFSDGRSTTTSEVAAAGYPFAQSYHKGFYAIGPEVGGGLSWDVDPLDMTFFIRVRAALTFGNERTAGLLTQSDLGSFPFDYSEATTLELYDGQAGLTWRPWFLHGLELSAGCHAEAGPSTYSSYATNRFTASVLIGAFFALRYDY